MYIVVRIRPHSGRGRVMLNRFREFMGYPFLTTNKLGTEGRGRKGKRGKGEKRRYM